MPRDYIQCRRCRTMFERADPCPNCGEPEPWREWTAEDEARRLAAEGRIIDAIMVLRSAGYGLKEARDLVDSWPRR